MADDITVNTPDGQVVHVPVVKEDGEIEVETEWLTSAFEKLQSGLASLAGTLQAQGEAITRQTDLMNQLESRVPSNLSQMISDQQTTITALVGQSLDTVRSLLTPPAPPPPVIEPESPVVIESPPPAPPPNPPASRRLRKI